jgi:hypothetical protein
MRGFVPSPEAVRSATSQVPAHVHAAAERLRAARPVLADYAHSSGVRLRDLTRDLIGRLELADLLDALPPHRAAPTGRTTLERVIGLIDAYRDQARELARPGH